jgi:cold-inducible RNA-binding protein
MSGARGGHKDRMLSLTELADFSSNSSYSRKADDHMAPLSELANFGRSDWRIKTTSKKLFVGNLSYRAGAQDLVEYFAKVGVVESATVVENRETGRSRGFGFVEMATPEEAAKAITQLHGKEFYGRILTVEEYRPGNSRNNREFRW